jgi:hypothetical protein
MDLDYYADIIELKKGGMPPRNKKNFRSTKSGAGISTTFSGPIKAGNIFNTTGTTLGTDVKNVGQVVMCQSQAVTQADGTTNIVIPCKLTNRSY